MFRKPFLTLAFLAVMAASVVAAQDGPLSGPATIKKVDMEGKVLILTVGGKDRPVRFDDLTWVLAVGDKRYNMTISGNKFLSSEYAKAKAVNSEDGIAISSLAYKDVPVTVFMKRDTKGVVFDKIQFNSQHMRNEK